MLNQTSHNIKNTIQTGLSTQTIKDALSKMSKKGKLPGYQGDVSEGIAEVAAHGTPFDSKLILTHEDNRLIFTPKLLTTMPAIFCILLIVSIWPGLPLTDVFLSSFQWYERFVANTGIQTWYWYLPLTVLPAPFAWKSAIKKSKLTAEESMGEAVEKIRKVLEHSSN